MKAIANYNNLKKELEMCEYRKYLLIEYIKEYSREKEELDKLIYKQKKVINEVEQNLRQLNGIDNKLFCEIVINGTNISKSVEKIAEEYDKDVSTIWKNYYPNIKEIIEELSNS